MLLIKTWEFLIYKAVGFNKLLMESVRNAVMYG